MEIVIGIGMAVMMPVMSGPPKSALLSRGPTEESEAELEEAAGLVASMGKIAMKGARDSELADEKHEGAESDRFKIKSGPKDGKTDNVDQDEKEAGKRNAKTTVHGQLYYRGKELEAQPK